MKKVVLPLALISFVSLSSLQLSLPVHAEESGNTEVSQQISTFSSEDIQQVRENLFEMGISEEVVEKLVKKLQSGKTLDADFLSEESAIDEITTVEDDVTIVTYVYPDGSRSQMTSEEIPAENLPEGLTPSNKARSISGGSCSGGSGYTICTGRKISYTLATYGFSFYASYEHLTGAYDKINSAGDWNIWVAGGNYTNASMRTIKRVESLSGKAEARLSATINPGGDVGSITRSLSLLVGGDKATDKWNIFY